MLGTEVKMSKGTHDYVSGSRNLGTGTRVAGYESHEATITSCLIERKMETTIEKTNVWKDSARTMVSREDRPYWFAQVVIKKSE